MKTYTSASNAKRGAKKNYPEGTELVIRGDKESGFVALDEVDADVYDRAGGFVRCPHCDVHLDNGISQHAPNEGPSNDPDLYKNDKYEFACLGCGEEFGDEIEAEKEPGTGIKIQKDREERNGIVRPSVGGSCDAVWSFCDKFVANMERAPQLKELKAHAEGSEWNINNAVIEYYQWRKFNGIVGRLK